MIRAARALAEASRLGSFMAVVLTFAVIGPFVGSVVVWLMAVVMKLPSDETQIFAAIGSIILFVFFGYIFGLGFALIAGAVVAFAGIWMRQNNILVAVGATVAASVIGALAQKQFISGIWGSVHAWGMFPICLVPTLVCWYITRGIVRATWLPA